MLYFRSYIKILYEQHLLTEMRCKVKYDLKKYSILVVLDSSWICQQVTWCNGRSIDRKGPLDLRDCAEAPKFFIIWIYEFSFTWILLLNKPQKQCKLEWVFGDHLVHPSLQTEPVLKTDQVA